MFVAKKEPPFRTAHLHRDCAARKTAWIGSFVHAGMITSFKLTFSWHQQKLHLDSLPIATRSRAALISAVASILALWRIMSYPSPEVGDRSQGFLIPQWHHEVPKSIIARHAPLGCLATREPGANLSVRYYVEKLPDVSSVEGDSNFRTHIAAFERVLALAPMP